MRPRARNSNLVWLLLQFKANPKAKDSLGNTPLHYALGEFSSPSEAEGAFLLLVGGADLHLKNKEGKSAKDLMGEVNCPESQSIFRAMLKVQEERIDTSAKTS